MSKAQNFNYITQLAKERIKEKQYKLDLLTLLQHFGGWDEFGYTKKELDDEIEKLQKYIYIATH